MTYFQYISKHIDRIKFEMRLGIVPCALLKHWQIYAKFDYYRKSGELVGMAVEYCCDDFRVTASWVFRIITKMESEIDESNYPVTD